MGEGASPLLVAWLARLGEAARLGPVADLACGRGRHALAVAARGIRTLGIDRDARALSALREAARAQGTPVLALRADLEAPQGIPLRRACCGAVLVFRFLFRPLAPEIEAVLAPGGLLVYETFTIHQRNLGQGPRNEAFLLAPGELRRLFPGLEILSSWEGVLAGPPPQALARLVARRPA